MMRGTVANVIQIADSIREAVSVASKQAGIKVSSFNVGVADIHFNSMRYRNWVTINNSEHIVMEEDVERLINDVHMMKVPSDYFILHVIPEEYLIDEESSVRNPVGVSASKLEAIYHIILAQKTSTDNLRKAIKRAGYEINKLILQPLASANAVLDENEKELGVAVIDIGGGTTDVIVFHNGSVRHSRVIGIAGNHVTNDIRSAFGIITEQSEGLKIEYGYATPKAIVKDTDVFVSTGGFRQPIRISLSILAEVIQYRMKELFHLIDNELKKANLKDKLAAGIVLTGGGSLLKGCVDLAKEVFGKDTRIGMPYNLGGMIARKLENPIFSTAVGLLKDGIQNVVLKESIIVKERASFFEKIKKFLREL